MSRDYRLYLDDILESSEKVQAFTKGLSYDEFVSDPRTIDAVVRNLEIIGEAVKSVPPDWLELQPHVDWKRIKRFRDLIVHHYFKVELEVVWTIVTGRIDELRNATRYILDQLEDP
jgi:uncharacterized protein with HEPN domain